MTYCKLCFWSVAYDMAIVLQTFSFYSSTVNIWVVKQTMQWQIIDSYLISTAQFDNLIFCKLTVLRWTDLICKKLRSSHYYANTEPLLWQLAVSYPSCITRPDLLLSIVNECNIHQGIRCVCTLSLSPKLFQDKTAWLLITFNMHVHNVWLKQRQHRKPETYSIDRLGKHNALNFILHRDIQW